jgi:hypothetical protein
MCEDAHDCGFWKDRRLLCDCFEVRVVIATVRFNKQNAKGMKSLNGTKNIAGCTREILPTFAYF